MEILAWHNGGPGPWILFVPLAWAAVAVVVGTVVRGALRRRGGPALRWWTAWAGARPAGEDTSPVAVLGRRFAAGEIDEDEYWRRMSVLNEHFGGPHKA
jgi:putative membrane protein